LEETTEADLEAIGVELAALRPGEHASEPKDKPKRSLELELPRFRGRCSAWFSSGQWVPNALGWILALPRELMACSFRANAFYRAALNRPGIPGDSNS
jgi:hypothetical protein